MIVIWALAIYTFVVAMRVYGEQLRQIDPGFTPPDVRVGTPYYAAATFFVILYLTRGYGWRTALSSAFIGAAAAPMIFELPFDLIVMPMTYPPLPPNPALYRQIFSGRTYHLGVTGAGNDIRSERQDRAEGKGET